MKFATATLFQLEILQELGFKSPCVTCQCKVKQRLVGAENVQGMITQLDFSETVALRFHDQGCLAYRIIKLFLYVMLEVQREVSDVQF